MSPNPAIVAAKVSGETGLAFESGEGRDADGHQWIELRPAGHSRTATFALRTTIAWRRLEVEFRPGAFAGELLAAMGSVGSQERSIFASVLRQCEADGASVDLVVNGSKSSFDQADIWTAAWRSLSIKVVRRQIAVGVAGEGDDERLAVLWTGRVAAAILALLPLESESASAEVPDDLIGLPEGAKTRIEVNRYERDRRNRAAALSIHGFACKACDANMADLYGLAAAGLIEVHHVTPVSVVGEGYVVDPLRDLVPLCPNCHAVAHRRSPPFSVDEIRTMLAASPKVSLSA